MELPDVIAAHLDELRSLAASCGVASVAIVGSVSRGDFDPGSSDLDLLVDFGPYTDDIGERAVRFHDHAQRVFDRRVDVISTHGVRNSTWRAILEATKIPIYAAA